MSGRLKRISRNRAQGTRAIYRGRLVSLVRFGSQAAGEQPDPASASWGGEVSACLTTKPRGLVRMDD